MANTAPFISPGVENVDFSREHTPYPLCLHCNVTLPCTLDSDFCCRGCEAVYNTLHQEGLSDFYRLRTTPSGGTPQQVTRWRDSRATPSPWVQELIQNQGTATTFQLRVQGVHCGACVWAIEQLFTRQPGAQRIRVNPTQGTIVLHVETHFDLSTWVNAVESIGYSLGPNQRSPADAPNRSTSRGLLIRMGVSLALAGNAMLLSVALYLGLEQPTTPGEQLLQQLFRHALFALSTLTLMVGAPVFLRGAFQALRRGILHLDLPISIGMVLGYGASTWSHFGGTTGGYLDSVAVFVALMLVGRYLQERQIEVNRKRILDPTDAANLPTRRKTPTGSTELVALSSIQAGDHLLVAPQELVPVQSHMEPLQSTSGPQLNSEHLEIKNVFSLEWIRGESEPVEIQGAPIPAGAFNATERTLTLVADQTFEDSSLPALMQATSSEEVDQLGLGQFWQRLSGTYVAGVLLLASVGFALGVLWHGSAIQGLEISTAILIVTCPCAFGIAVPLAYELVLGNLRRHGLFVRRARFLDRARSVRRVVFDKTGTLTTGALQVSQHEEAPKAATFLPILHTMVSRARHPKSEALTRHCQQRHIPTMANLHVALTTGFGIEARHLGHRFRLGQPHWATANDSTGAISPSNAVLFSMDDRPLATYHFDEEFRHDALREVQELQSMGYETWIVSGDDPDHVKRAAHRLQIPPERALGGQTPNDKQSFVAQHDKQDMLMVGDGLNDSLAVSTSWCSGAAAVDQPFVAAKSDFYLLAAGLKPITHALQSSHRLARVVRRNLVFAVAYNLVAVALSYTGLMQPWLAAVLMPASSLFVVGTTVLSLSRSTSMGTTARHSTALEKPPTKERPWKR